MATKPVRRHNRSSTYRTIKTKTGTNHVYVKSTSVKSHRRKSR